MIPSKTEYKRPDHPDFMDFHELKKIKFSGIRKNDMSGYLEIWVMGEPKGYINQNSSIEEIEKLIAEIFLLENVRIERPNNAIIT